MKNSIAAICMENLNGAKQLSACLDWLKDNGNKVIVFVRDGDTRKKCLELGIETENCPTLPKNAPKFLLVLCGPGLILLACLWLMVKNKRQKLNSLILFDIPSQFIITPCARLLKIKVFWLALPGIDKEDLPSLFLYFYRLASRSATTLAFTEKTITYLKEKGISPDKLVKLPFGPNPKLNVHQESIFSKLASADNATTKKKFFTVGTIVDLDKRKPTELLLRSLQTAKTVIPNIQLIVIGDGKERKNLAWTSKKLGVDQLVWFVGKQVILSKWFGTFDIYIEPDSFTGIDNLANAILAANHSLPLIAPQASELDELIINNDTGLLLDKNESEELVGAIISLYKNGTLRRRLGRNAKEEVDKRLNFANMCQRIMEIINI